MHSMREFSCGAIIYRLQRGKPLYLILHYEAGHWDFPKGNVEKGERPVETAAREIREETGITRIEFEEGFKEKITYFFKRGRETVFKQVIFFLARTTQKKVALSFEHVGSKWLEFDKARGQLTYKNAEQLLEKAGKFLAREKKSQTKK